MTLRLSQWPSASTSRAGEVFLPPARLIEVLKDVGTWEWIVADGFEEFELAGQTGKGFDNLTTWYEQGSRVPTSRLVRALTSGKGLQLVWGELRAYEQDGSEPVITISAFDSTSYEIEARRDLITRLEAEFAWARQPA